MSATLQRIPTDFWDKWDSIRMHDGGPPPAEQAEATEAPATGDGRSFGRRALRACLRVMITLGIGVGGTLAWQAYGDDARRLVATTYPLQLGWMAPQAATTAVAAPSEPAALASAAPAGPPVDQQQINALSLNVAAVRQTVEQLAAQVAAGQQQMSGDIAKLQAGEQDILAKVSAPPPPPRPPAARKPTPAPAATAAPPPPAR
jgi:hypothetical protein